MVGIDPSSLSTVAKDLQDAKNEKDRAKEKTPSAPDANSGEVRQSGDRVEIPPALDMATSTIGGSDEATAVVRALMEGMQSSPDASSKLHGEATSSDRLMALLKD